MFKQMLMAAVVMGLLGSASVWAEGGTATPVVKKRQHHQMRRIRQGVRSGQLTKEETKGLLKDEKDIQKAKAEAKADGVVTMEERKELHQKLNEESNKIYNEKHDSETRNK